ncbi:uncharacterized protein LOC119735084 [Patiria miniata]|uniref:Uncharacterized protein n=1 Tax=Patiria miniata TaxID=46514 RepID=A0A914AMP5_PATMI|nr:uncharacterized protein LOC119735084 [Patiria miniata]
MTLCQLGREPYTESAYDEWQVLNSTFLCECNDATATSAEYYRFKDGAFSSLNSTCEENGGSPDPSASNSGVIAGSVVAVVLVLLIIVAVVIVWYRKGGKKLVSGRKKRVSKSRTAASADDTEGRQRYAGDFLPSGAHRNPAFAASLDPSPEPDEDYGYINPDTVQPSRQPDKQPASGETGSHSTPKQRPPIVAPYQPKPTNAGQTGSDHGPNMPTSDQGYTSLTPPLGSPLNPQSSPLEGGFSGSDNDGGYQALTTGPHVDLPSSPDHDAYNHLEFTK